MASVQMPDGTVVEMPDQLDPALGARLRAFQNSHAAPTAPAQATAKAAEPSTAAKVGNAAYEYGVNSNPAVGAIEKLGQGVTGLLSKIGGGFAGAATGFMKSIGAKGFEKSDPAAVVHAVQDQGTYQPRTAAAATYDELGRRVYAATGAPKLDAKINGSIENSDSPAVRTFVPAGIEAAGDIASLVGPGKVGAEAVAPAVERAVAPKIVEGAAKPTVGAGQTAVETGRSAGFKFTPGGVESRMPAAALNGDIPQSFATNAGDRRTINLHNQARATELAGEQMGKKGATSLAPKDFEDAKEPHQQVYTDTGTMLGDGLKGSDEFINALKSRLADDTQTQLKGGARSQAQRILNAAQSGNLSGPQMVKDISWLRANGGRSVAKMLEGELETQLGANSPQVGKLRDARTALAQINNLQEVTKGGQIDANALARLDEQNPGLLTGNLKIIAQSAAASPQDFRLPSGVQPGSSPLSKPTLLGTAKAAAGKVAKTVAPGRFDVTSDAFQNRFGREATDTEKSYMQDFAKRQGAPSEAFALKAPEGSTGVQPVQRGMELPPGPPARPTLDLERPEGQIGEGPSRQLGMEMAQGRPLDEQKLDLSKPEGMAFEPHQHDLLKSTLDRRKGKARGKD